MPRESKRKPESPKQSHPKRARRAADQSVPELPPGQQPGNTGMIDPRFLSPGPARSGTGIDAIDPQLPPTDLPESNTEPN